MLTFVLNGHGCVCRRSGSILRYWRPGGDKRTGRNRSTGTSKSQGGDRRIKTGRRTRSERRKGGYRRRRTGKRKRSLRKPGGTRTICSKLP